ncbi:hypothetical protein Y023_5676 [Burkholderia pseudomallei A79D]|nr:hypothetical protein Y023_5676 [Burkholderia pseudomallei A79D]
MIIEPDPVQRIANIACLAYPKNPEDHTALR